MTMNEQNRPANEEEIDVVTLTDDETGEELQFEVLADAEIDGNVYAALAPLFECDIDGDYMVFQVVEEDGATNFYTIDDDDTFDKVAEFFDDLFFNEVNLDNPDGQ